MTRLLYSLVIWLAQPLLRHKLRRRSVQEPGYQQAVAERFGIYADAVVPGGAGFIWVHAVSLGETRAAAVLIASLREHLPTMRLLLTHGTATGRAEGAKLLQAGDHQAWLPWDSNGAVKRFLDHFQPRIGILMETEIWPNLVTACQRADVPLVLANARLNEKSLLWAKRLAWLARPAYRGLSAVWAQTHQDATRFAELGVEVKGIFGNLKFDATPDALQLATGRAWRRQLSIPVVLLASSRVGEEAALLQILASLRPAAMAGARVTTSPANDLQWLIVPRHPQRFDEVAALLKAQGFGVSRRSDWTDAAPVANGSIWLGDSLGEMALYYGLADIALLGGSFEPMGGQNLIEAAACGCPVLMGPHTFNFAEAAELALEAGAAKRVLTLQEAVAAALALTGNDAKLTLARQAANAFASTQRGASERLALSIEQLLVAKDRAST